VENLLSYARARCPDNFCFLRHLDLTIPVADASADFVLAFSLFTHLLHEESYVYLQDIHRALKPGGTLVFSFLQFAQPEHWGAFDGAVAARKITTTYPMTTFIEENVVRTWAQRIGFAVSELKRDHPIGQSVAVFSKP
jgi:SAM-dependent methyltransferase